MPSGEQEPTPAECKLELASRSGLTADAFSKPGFRLDVQEALIPWRPRMAESGDAEMAT